MLLNKLVVSQYPSTAADPVVVTDAKVPVARAIDFVALPEITFLVLLATALTASWLRDAGEDKGRGRRP